MNRYDKIIDEIRRFNRFYTINNSAYPDTEYSIAETSILFEIKSQKQCIQRDIAKTLHMDKSYLSRLIKCFYEKGLIEKNKSAEDKRATYISLTEKGNTETERLIELTSNRIKTKINNLSFDECDRLCNAMNVIISILERKIE